MNILRNRKFWLVACGLWLVACGLIAGSKVMSQEGNVGDNNEISAITTVRNIGSYPSVIRTALIRKIINKNGINKIEFDEIKKFDLSLPQSPDYRNDKEWSIFSRNDVLDIEGYEIIRKSVSEEKSRYVITLSNRIAELGTEQPELLVILPNVKKVICESIIKQTNDLQHLEPVTIPSLEKAPHLVPHPQIAEASEIIALPKNLQPSAGCVEAEDIYYYYQLVYEF